jgi:hypothetical protein
MHAVRDASAGAAGGGAGAGLGVVVRECRSAAEFHQMNIGLISPTSFVGHGLGLRCLIWVGFFSFVCVRLLFFSSCLA